MHKPFRGIESREPCDFIFDEQGKIGNDVLDLWDNMKALAEQLSKDGRTDFRPFLGSKPIFRSDDIFKPLQAADFYAWQVRRLFYENKILTMPGRPELRFMERIPSISFRLGVNELRRIREDMLRSGAAYLAANPNAELKSYEGSKKAQRRARVAKRTAARTQLGRVRLRGENPLECS